MTGPSMMFKSPENGGISPQKNSNDSSNGPLKNSNGAGQSSNEMSS